MIYLKGTYQKLYNLYFEKKKYAFDLTLIPEAGGLSGLLHRVVLRIIKMKKEEFNLRKISKQQQVFIYTFCNFFLYFIFSAHYIHTHGKVATGLYLCYSSIQRGPPCMYLPTTDFTHPRIHVIEYAECRKVYYTQYRELLDLQQNSVQKYQKISILCIYVRKKYLDVFGIQLILLKLHKSCF